MRRLVLALLAGACLLGLTASPASAAITHDQYIAQADPICADGNRAVKKAFKGLSGDLRGGRWAVAAGKFRRAGAIFSDGIDRLEVLERPTADADLLDRWIRKLNAQLPLVDRLVRALNKGAEKRIVGAFTKLASVSGKAQELVAGFGFSDCDRY